MENVLRAERDGTIKKIRVKQGDSVAVDAVILRTASSRNSLPKAAEPMTTSRVAVPPTLRSLSSSADRRSAANFHHCGHLGLSRRRCVTHCSPRRASFRAPGCGRSFWSRRCSSGSGLPYTQAAGQLRPDRRPRSGIGSETPFRIALLVIVAVSFYGALAGQMPYADANTASALGLILLLSIIAIVFGTRTTIWPGSWWRSCC